MFYQNNKFFLLDGTFESNPEMCESWVISFILAKTESTSNIMLRLARDIPRIVNLITFFDNFYTPLPLVIYLAKKKNHYLGTIQ